MRESSRFSTTENDENRVFRLARVGGIFDFFPMPRKDKAAILSPSRKPPFNMVAEKKEKNLVHLHEESVRHGEALRGKRLETIRLRAWQQEKKEVSEGGSIAAESRTGNNTVSLWKSHLTLNRRATCPQLHDR